MEIFKCLPIHSAGLDNFPRTLFQSDSIPAESYSDNDDSGHKNKKKQ